MLKDRVPAEWSAMDGAMAQTPTMWSWGNWYITKEYDGFHLLVSSGASYGPFLTFDAAKQHAEDVRGD